MTPVDRKQWWIVLPLCLLSVSLQAADRPKASLVSSVPADEMIHLGLVMKLDSALLAQSIESIYGRSAPAKKHFLSADEFAKRFDLDDKRKALLAFALAKGLTSDPQTSPSESMIVKVSGSAHAVEEAFGTALNRYRGSDGRLFRANASTPLIPSSLAPNLQSIVGFSDKTRVVEPQFHVMRRSNAQHASFTGTTGPLRSLAPADIKTIYDLGTTPLNGSGQVVAVFELDGYNPADITAYETQFALPSVAVTPISVDGVQNVCNNGASCTTQTIFTDSDMLEVDLDIELVMAVAPASQILVYEDTNTAQGVLDLYNQIAVDNTAQIISSSWDAPELDEDPTFLQAESQIFQRMAIQGQSIYSASGDLGAYNGSVTPNVNDPPSQPFVTGVGGTSLAGSVQVPAEISWNNSDNGATGGGVSAVWPIPTYQAGIPGIFSQTARNVPDVALDADPETGYSIFAYGSWIPIGGTSASAPLWAAMTALLNQQSAQLGGSVLGFANPTFYQQATGSNYHNLYNDITSGTNRFYSTGPGYDDATGWGSYKGTALINAIANEIPIVPPPPPLPPPTVNPIVDLSNVFAYPNPWDVRKNPPAVVSIKYLPSGSTVKVFTVSGFHVVDLNISNNTATWDLKNDSGKDVASGLYLYFVKYNGNVFRGKIAVIR